MGLDLGEEMVFTRTSTTGVLFFFSSLWKIIIPPGRYGIWFYCDHGFAPPSVLWFFVFGCRVSFFFFFLDDSSILLMLLWMVVEQSVVIWVFLKEGMNSNSSALPSYWPVDSGICIHVIFKSSNSHILK